MRNLFIAFVAAAGLMSPALLAGPDHDQNNLGTFMIVGDSLSAGYQNNQLIDCGNGGPSPCFGKPSGQQFGYANQIAKQAGVSLNLPLVAPPGYPVVSNISGYDVAVDFTHFLPVLENGPSQTLNISVPGFTLGAMLGYQAVCPPGTGLASVPFPIQVLAQTVLNPACPATPAPTELVEGATVAQSTPPGTLILWIGSNDALFPLLFFGDQPTDPFTFISYYDIALKTLAQSGKHVVVANIPDVTLLPYLISVPQLAAILQTPVPAVQAGLGLAPGDMVTPYVFAYMQAAPGQQLPPSITDPITGQGQVPVVIPAAQIKTLQGMVDIYNAEIAWEAARNGATLVDIHSLVSNIAAHGINIKGQKLTTDFMGGLFSLDGVHPSNTGYAVIANEFIRTMNKQLDTNIPSIDLSQVAANDPFVFGSGKPGKGPAHVTPGMAGGLRGIMHHDH